MLLFPQLLYINPMVSAHLNSLDGLLMVQHTKPNYTKQACSKVGATIDIYQDVNTCARKKKKKTNKQTTSGSKLEIGILCLT